MRRTLTRGFLEITGAGVAGTALLIPDTYRKVVPPQRNFGRGFDEFRKVWGYGALGEANKGDLPFFLGADSYDQSEEYVLKDAGATY